MNVTLKVRDARCAFCGAVECPSACPASQEWPRRIDRALLVARVLLSVAIFVGALVVYLRAPMPLLLALPSAVLTAGLIVAVLLAIEYLPSEPKGKVLPGRFRR